MIKTAVFGNELWDIIDEKDDRMLLISHDVLEVRAFDSNDFEAYWDSCELRHYLNSHFLKKFSKQEKTKIINCKLTNKENPYWRTYGGSDTQDRVFILDIYEVVKFLKGDNNNFTLSIESCRCNRKQDISFECDFYSDSGNGSRVALYKNAPTYWWLRCPGIHSHSAMAVCDDGRICVCGMDLNAILDVGGVGIRPAFWIKK